MFHNLNLHVDVGVIEIFHHHNLASLDDEGSREKQQDVENCCCDEKENDEDTTKKITRSKVPFKFLIGFFLIGFIIFSIVDAVTTGYIRQGMEDLLGWMEHNPFSGIFLFALGT